MPISRRELIRSIALTGLAGAFVQATGRVAQALAERADEAPVAWIVDGANHQNVLAMLGHRFPDLGALTGGQWNLTLYDPWLPEPRGSLEASLDHPPILVVESLDPFLAETPGKWVSLLAASKAVVFLGTDACYGGLQWGPDAVARVERLCSDTQTPFLKLPGIPVPPHHLVGVLGHLAFLGFPEVDRFGRPVLYYGETLCTQCERRWALAAGEYADMPGDPGCLLEVGCKGPRTRNSCAAQRWNGGVNWCVGAGAPCTGCSEPGYPSHAGLGLYGNVPGDRLAKRSRGLSWVHGAGWAFLGLAGAGVGLRALLGWLAPAGEKAPRGSEPPVKS